MAMKRILAVGFFLALIHPVFSQRINLNVYTSYVFDDKFDYYQDASTYYDGKILGGLQWGVGLEFLMRPEQGVELFYLRQDSHAPTNYQATGSFFPSDEDFELDMNYIMLAGVRRVGNPEKVQGYFAPALGMCILEATNPTTKKESSATKFAWGAKLGCDIALNPALKLKLQAQMTSPVQSVGGGLFFGTGGGGVGLGLYSTVYQFALGGGLVITPQSKKEKTPNAVPEGTY
jgi:hypothetical protein